MPYNFQSWLYVSFFVILVILMGIRSLSCETKDNGYIRSSLVSDSDNYGTKVKGHT